MFLRSGLCYNTTTTRDMDKRASQASKTKKEKGERTMEVVVAKKPIEKVAHCNNDHTCNCC